MTRPIVLIMMLSLPACHSTPIWPDPLQPTAYRIHTVPIPALEDATLSIGGVWAHDRTLIVDMVIDHPATDDDRTRSDCSRARPGCPSRNSPYSLRTDGAG